jgi:CMP-N,N'-diacetyllegionaminic acid synthase
MHNEMVKIGQQRIRTSRVLGLITARGGSKGLPRKNILPAGGRPLIAWTISAALKSDVISQVILSSDDAEIIQVALEWGCEVPFTRPVDLASDIASTIDVALHALDQLPGFEFIVLLQPTSPLRTAEDIDAAFALMQASGAPSCVSVCEAEQSPYWMYQLLDGSKLLPLITCKDGVTRRQDLPPVYVLNGAIYIARIDWLRETKSFVGEETIAYLMPKERSVDIDNAADFENFCAKVNARNDS